MVRQMSSRIPSSLMILTLAACASMQMGSTPKDGELALPSEYKAWPVFLRDVQKPDAVRDLYVNPTGAKASQGQMFPNGTQFVMEIHSAKKDLDGAYVKDPDGKLVKDKP